MRRRCPPRSSPLHFPAAVDDTPPPPPNANIPRGAEFPIRRVLATNTPFCTRPMDYGEKTPSIRFGTSMLMTTSQQQQQRAYFHDTFPTVYRKGEKDFENVKLLFPNDDNVRSRTFVENSTAPPTACALHQITTICRYMNSNPLRRGLTHTVDRIMGFFSSLLYTRSVRKPAVKLWFRNKRKRRLDRLVRVILVYGDTEVGKLHYRIKRTFINKMEMEYYFKTSDV